jgi:hypothetical protein
VAAAAVTAAARLSGERLTTSTLPVSVSQCTCGAVLAHRAAVPALEYCAAVRLFTAAVCSCYARCRGHEYYFKCLNLVTAGLFLQ